MSRTVPQKTRLALLIFLCLTSWSLWQCKQAAVPSASARKPSPRPTHPPLNRQPTTNTTQTTAKLVPLNKYFKPNQTFAFVIPQLKPLNGVGVPRAANCKVCHSNYYNEWKRTTHAAALRDLQYQAELAKPGSPKWLCLNCHTPIQNQRKSIIKYLKQGNVFHPVGKKNPGYDPVMQKEAITCATCHVRPDANGNSVVIGAIGSKLAPHPVKRDPAFLRKICLRCHDPKGKRLTRHLMCWFKTKDELANNPLAKKQDCVSCHMPTTVRRLVPGWTHLPKRKSHMHHWVGGGVPKSFDGYKDLLKRGYKPGIKVTLSSIQNDPKKRIVKWALAVQNKYAGHWMPTADPERFLLLHATLLDPKQVARKRTKHRIGQTWKWEPMAQKVGDNRLKPNETRTWNASFALPTQHKGYTLRLQVYHVRLSSQTAAYMQSHAHKYKSAPLAIRNKIAQLSKHYPMATVLYRLDIQLDTNKQRSYSRKELIQLSAKEQHKPLKLRDY